MSDIIISLLSTDAVIALVIGAFVTYIVKWLSTEHGDRFQQYQGWAVTAIKAAERVIPDDVEGKGLRKLDYALRVFVDKYTKATGVKPKDAELAKIEAWISEIHAALESAGGLRK